MNRGADRQDIFTDDGDRLYFEALLGDTTNRFGIEIHAYCLMGNHFHLLVFCPTEVFSAAIQHLSSTYAMHYNRTYERSGPLFGGRFCSVIVNNDIQLAQVSRYVHRNPLALGPLGALVAYRWSSLGVYAGRRPGFAWLHRESILGLYNFTEDTYREFVETAQPSDTTPESVLVPRIPPRCDEIELAVSRAAGIEVTSLHVIKRAVPNHARLLAMLMMTESRSATTKELADRFGLANQTSVRSATRRARVLLASDPAFAQLHKRATTNLDRAA
jgi:putative transposase